MPTPKKKHVGTYYANGAELRAEGLIIRGAVSIGILSVDNDILRNRRWADHTKQTTW